VVTGDRAEALAHAASCGRVLVVEFLDGPEVSLFAVTDGASVVPLLPAQDFKRVGDGDTGPNTGGMGAYAPLAWVPDGLVEEVVTGVLQPTVDEMAARGTPFQGLLYAGLALTSNGVRVVEFNARFGDPETQVLLSLLESPLGQLLYAAARGRLAELPPLRWRPGAAVTVVVASRGYPGSPGTGDPVSGVDEARRLDGVEVIHAGTALDGDRLVSSGGRVLAVTAVGASLAAARERAYAGVARIRIDGAHHRSDIAARPPVGLAASVGPVETREP
jgi:phosphoribosylamine--glycine ligase